MGCNNTTPALVSENNSVQEIPCTPEEIGRYLNDVRANPKKYADLLRN